MNRLLSVYLFIGKWGMAFFLLNIFWFIFSLLGGVVLGVFPATAALFSVLRNKVVLSKDGYIITEFWTVYKRDFIKANALGFMISGILLFLYFEIRVLALLGHSLFHTMISNLLYLVILIFVMVMIYAFPLFVHFDLSLVSYIKYAIVLTIAKPIQTFLLIVSVVLAMALYRTIPGLIPVFGVSIYCFIIMKITSLSFAREEVTE